VRQLWDFRLLLYALNGKVGVTVEKMLNRLYEETGLSKDEIVYMITKLDAAGKIRLYELARKKQREYYDDHVYLRGLIEFSNHCRRNCLYCGIRRSNQSVDRYRLKRSQILECCEVGYQLGYRTFVLQSGEDGYYNDHRLTTLIEAIKGRYPDAAVTLSIGERGEDTYQKLFDAGADRFLLRHETASRRLYEILHPKASYDERIQCLKVLKRIGYQVGSGFMVGLPKQTAEDLADDLLFLKELQPDMIGIGPFITHSGTPLKFMKGGTLDQTLVLIALARLIIPDSLIPATTAIGSIHPQGRELALKAGANVMMPNLTPIHIKEKYELYDNKICTTEQFSDCHHCMIRSIELAGFKVSMGRGDSHRFVRKSMLEAAKINYFWAT
jgi:biotin synthase